jgi:L-lysine exporter family protein LysE/ArgO
MFDISSFTQGLALGLGMFICPGPKDVLILRQAIFRYPAAKLIAVGVLSDAFLIWLGIAGASTALSHAPSLQHAALWLGVCLMTAHGLIAARRALAGAHDVAALSADAQAMPYGKNLVVLLAVSFFNPVAWLDTVLVIGTVGAALPQPTQLSYAMGAIAASLCWFVSLVLGGRSAGRWMTKPSTWRVLDGCVAIAMMGLSAQIMSGLI